jgi:predicted O-methyltransferase YrrM
MNHTPKTRAELALFVPASGVMIELGVAAGLFAVELIKANPHAYYIGIDRWSDHHDTKEMQSAETRIKAETKTWQLMRETFVNALSYFKDESADMIYIDGYAHTGQNNGQTLDDWWPKVKKGGIFAGHDYCKEYHQTMRVVDDFVAKHGATLNIIDDSDCPSWWIVKG